jgi:hypothetical protein
LVGVRLDVEIAPPETEPRTTNEVLRIVAVVNEQTVPHAESVSSIRIHDDARELRACGGVRPERKAAEHNVPAFTRQVLDHNPRIWLIRVEPAVP